MGRDLSEFISRAPDHIKVSASTIFLYDVAGGGEPEEFRAPPGFQPDRFIMSQYAGRNFRMRTQPDGNFVVDVLDEYSGNVLARIIRVLDVPLAKPTFKVLTPEEVKAAEKTRLGNE